jgi:hypothetical protein
VLDDHRAGPAMAVPVEDRAVPEHHPRHGEFLSGGQQYRPSTTDFVSTLPHRH